MSKDTVKHPIVVLGGGSLPDGLNKALFGGGGTQKGVPSLCAVGREQHARRKGAFHCGKSRALKKEEEDALWMPVISNNVFGGQQITSIPQFRK